MTWQLSDLNGSVVNLFLCQSAFSQHYTVRRRAKSQSRLQQLTLRKQNKTKQNKTMEGTILAVINPGVMSSKEGGKFCFKCRKEDEIALIGKAMDYGQCQATSKNNQRCSEGINVADVRVCIDHFSSWYAQRANSTALNTNRLRREQSCATFIWNKSSTRLVRIDSNCKGLLECFRIPRSRDLGRTCL